MNNDFSELRPLNEQALEAVWQRWDEMKKAEPAPPPKLYYRIGEVARMLGVTVVTLRYWETEFKQLRPRRFKKLSSQRYYRPGDVEIAKRIHQLLHVEGYTVRGAKKRMEGEA